jgi:hypothetical protein
MEPTLQVLSDNKWIMAWISWPYDRVNTVRNKISHVIKLVEWCLVFKCNSISNYEGAAMVLDSLWDAAGIAKAKGLRQCVMLQHSKLHMAEGMNSHSLSLSCDHN